MHEFSICGLLLKALDHEYDSVEPPPRGLESVTVVVGALHQIVPDYLQGAFRALTADGRFAGTELKLEHVPVRGDCPACGWVGTIQPPLFVCPDCHKPGVELRSGKELHIRAMEVNT
jgi:hydrogenase nickel incorporation protein HypA/HybF